MIRIIVFGGLNWGPLILGSYHVGLHGGSIGISTVCIAFWVFSNEGKFRNNGEPNGQEHGNKMEAGSIGVSAD